MDEFELEDNLEFILQSIQELIEDQGDDNPFGEVNQNELLANLVNYDQDNLMPDVSAEDVANGKDVQGIPWEKMLFPRNQYREMKMKSYKNYQNLSYAREDLQECKQVEKDSPYYDFQYNTRRARPSIVHFQLRNLVWSTTKHDVYTVHNQSLTHWSSLDQISTELINGDDCIIPKQRGHGSQSVSMVQFTTMAVDNDLLVVGGFQGELICKRLEDDGIVFSTRVTEDENAITNSLEIYEDPNGSRRLVAANNDCSVRIFDTEYFDLLNHYVFPWSVNCVSVNPDGTLFAVLGDHEDGLVVDPKCGKESGKTCGETQRADDARVERQITSEIHMHQRDTSKVPISETVGGKRSLSHGSESSRARKDAKIIDAKVEMTQLKNSKTPRRKMSPIVSRSPIMNMIARNKAQSHAGTPKSPKLHARSPNLHPRSPNQAGTSRSPNLHDLSPTLAHGTPTTSDELPPTATNGSKRKPRKLTSIVWNDVEPIYIDGLLTQGRCKYCNTVFPASKVSGSSQLARHLKVYEVKCSMDGVVQQIRTSDEIDPDWKFDQQAARFELVKLIVLHGLPFSFVEYAGFRKFCASLNPWFKSVNRVTVQNDCMDAYYSYRSIYQNFFMNCNHRVSLTGDMWTSNQKLGYLCITCHWIDSNWKIKHRIIRFCVVETPRASWNMFDVV